MFLHSSDRFWLGAGVLWLLANLSPMWYPTPDACGYLSIARTLARSCELRNLGSSQLYYQIGYPLSITPWFWLDDEPFLYIMISHAALAVGIMLMVYHWAQRVAPRHAGWLALLSVGTVSFGNVYRRPLSETLFMFLLFATAELLRKALRSNTYAFWACLAMMGLVITRAAGAMLAPAWWLLLLWEVWQSRMTKTRAVLLSLLVVPAGLAQAALILHDRAEARRVGNLTYTAQFRDEARTFGAQILEGCRLRIQENGRLLIPGMYKSYAQAGEWANINFLWYLPLAILTVRGLIRQGLRTADLLILTIPGYTALHIVWPYDQSTRFFTPIAPVLALGAVMGLPRHWRTRFTTVKVARTTTVLHLLVALGFWWFSERRENLKLQESVPNLRHIATMIPSEQRGLVAMSAEFRDEPNWMQFLLDRRVAVRRTPNPEDRWWICPQNCMPPSGVVIWRGSTCLLIQLPSLTGDDVNR